MRKKTVMGNWKMNGSHESIDILCQGLKSQCGSSSVDIAVFPPDVYISRVINALQGVAIAVGAQDVSQYESGAYTGEVSAAMLADVGCSAVIIGHSERRQYHKESNELIAQKFVAATKANLQVVFCLGETLEQREANNTELVVSQQLQAVLDVTHAEDWENAVIAYEPVWAIGTGQAATPDQAQAVHAFLRAALEKWSPSVAKNTRIVYGGSVKPANAAELFALPDIDGALVGGASLKAEDFAGIIKEA